jgi:5-methylcytosine-specific restriction endonuclease McrBC regulatory subunit McrC
MNKLFQDFIGNLLKERLATYEIELQRAEHPEKTRKRLIIYLDIMISRNGIPLLIIDTKYQKFSEEAKVDHIEQITLYSNTTHVKNCVLVYVGKSWTPP